MQIIDIKTQIVCTLIEKTPINACILYTVLRKYPIHSIETAIEEIKKERR